MGYRSVVEPLLDMLEDSIPCNKEGKKWRKVEGEERREGGRKERRETDSSACGGGRNSQVISEICHQPGVSNYLASPNARSLGICAADSA